MSDDTFIIIISCFWAVLALWCQHLLDQARAAEREVRNWLDETRTCNEEFKEAIALLRYGATEEAMEVASRWKQRLGYSEAE